MAAQNGDVQEHAELQQRLEQGNPYLAGFLAGFKAAARQNLLSSSPSSSIKTSLPVPNLFPNDNTLIAQNQVPNPPDFQLNELAGTELWGPVPSTIPSASPNPSMFNGDSWNAPDTSALTLNEIVPAFGIVRPTDASIDITQEAATNDELILLASDLNSTIFRRSSQPKSSAYSGPKGVSRMTAGSTVAIFRAYGSNRSKLNEKSRALTAFTRQIGACATCRRKKLRCDQSSKDKFVPCGRCARQPSHLLNTPCCRIDIIEIKLFRLGSFENSLSLQEWFSSQEDKKKSLLLLQNAATASAELPRRLDITHDVTHTTFAVTVSRFEPGPGDATGYVWNDANGERNEYTLPPFYISNPTEAAENIRQYAWKARSEFTRALLINCNPIVQKTFVEAERYYTVTKSPLVAAALMFWSTTRMIERFWLIVGEDQFGMPPMRENIGPCRRNHYMDGIPVTPIMDTQLDELAIRVVLVPLKNKLLQLLKTKMLAKKKEYWYEIYIASFIILHNEERVLLHVLDFGRRYGVNPPPRTNDESSLSQGYLHACKTLLVYFHFACGGAAPLSLDWLKQDTVVMDEAQLAYLADIKSELARQGTLLRELGNMSMYGTELYWCHQLLFPNWKADMPHVGELLEFTEKDFLVS